MDAPHNIEYGIVHQRSVPRVGITGLCSQNRSYDGHKQHPCNDFASDPNHIRSFAAQNGAGAEGEMDKGSEGIEANVSFGDKENNGHGSSEANHVARRSQEDRSVPESEMAEDQGAAEEGGVAASLTRNQQVVPNVIFPMQTTHSRV